MPSFSVLLAISTNADLPETAKERRRERERDDELGDPSKLARFVGWNPWVVSSWPINKHRDGDG